MTTHPERRLPNRVGILAYGLVAYLVFLLSILYYIGFLANVVVPNGIDEGAVGSTVPSIATDLGLLAIFGIQHSLMARSWFKDRWTRLIPEPIERSTYVLTSALVLLVAALLWRPIPTVVWDVAGVAGWAFWAVFGLGVVLVIVSSFQISHPRLFGLQQVWDAFTGRASAPVQFQTPGFYRYVRHPLMTGLLLWFWATPHMTVGHLLFAGGFSVYILAGTRLEERMLMEDLGAEYRAYRQAVPMFFPRVGRSVDSSPDETSRSRE